MKQPFARFLSIMTAVQAMIGSGMSMAAAINASGAADYKSRGKGKGNNSVSFKIRRYLGKKYPATSTKQHQKNATRQYTIVRNGFEIMQTRKRADYLTMSQVA